MTSTPPSPAPSSHRSRSTSTSSSISSSAPPATSSAHTVEALPYDRPPAIDPTDNQYRVEKLVGRRRTGMRVEYEVKWQGYPDSENTWERKEDINSELIMTYLANLLAANNRAGNRKAVKKRGRKAVKKRDGKEFKKGGRKVVKKGDGKMGGMRVPKEAQKVVIEGGRKVIKGRVKDMVRT